MRRLIDNRLITWKDSIRRKPLIVRGARQVGKTWSGLEFGREHFGGNVVHVDLERNPSWRRIFEKDLDVRRMKAELEVMVGRKIEPGRTLLFLDEIQSCPRAVTALRYFFEEMPGLHVLAAGSLIEFALRDIAFPVGRIEFLEMRPLGFSEYLWALGRDDLAGMVLSEPLPVSEAAHEVLLDHLRQYFFVGGMPECVDIFRQTGSMQASFEIQQQLVEAFRHDFPKYAPRSDKRCLEEVLANVARRVGGRIKYASLADGYSNKTISNAFRLLVCARLVTPIGAASPSGLPLGAAGSSRRFKALILDIGLMRYLCSMPVEVEYRKSDLLSVYRGAMAEQFVGQEMLLSQEGSLFFWAKQAKSSTAEVDFLAVKQGKIHPVEVKSGATGRLKSIRACLDGYPNCPSGMVFSSAPYQAEKRGLLRLPLYFAYSATMK